jgi:hypothetical protein
MSMLLWETEAPSLFVFAQPQLLPQRWFVSTQGQKSGLVLLALAGPATHMPAGGKIPQARRQIFLWCVFS